ncbi:MAG: hypothetical protein AB2693_27330 [Candidatus Thiodiazotropha sp.]
MAELFVPCDYGLERPIVHTKLQGYSLSFLDKILEVFFYYGHGSHVGPSKLLFPLILEAPHEILLLLAQWSWRRTLKMQTDI